MGQDIVSDLNLPPLSLIHWQIDPSQRLDSEEFFSALEIDGGLLFQISRGGDFRVRGKSLGVLAELTTSLRALSFQLASDFPAQIRIIGVLGRDECELGVLQCVPGTEHYLYPILSTPAVNGLLDRVDLVLHPSEPGRIFLRTFQILLDPNRKIPKGIRQGELGINEVFRRGIRTSGMSEFSVKVQQAGGDLLGAVGVQSQGPITFVVEAQSEGGPARTLWTQTLRTAGEWVPLRVPLSGQGSLSLKLLTRAEAGEQGSWGSLRTVYPANRGQRPKRVILIVADTLRSDHLPFLGYPRPTAPALSEIANRSVIFEDAYAVSSWTKPSLPALHCSLSPRILGVFNPYGQIDPSVTTLAESFQAAGFTTFGVASNPYAGRSNGLGQGFDVFFEPGSLGLDAQFASKTASRVVDTFLGWLEGKEDLPIFASLHVMDPHQPYRPQSPLDEVFMDDDALATYEDLQQNASALLKQHPHALTLSVLEQNHLDWQAMKTVHQGWYDASILGMDRALARLFNRLAEKNLLDDTLIVFTSDHGEEFFEHGGQSHGHQLYGELVKVPLFFYFPKQLIIKRISGSVSLLDVMPTVLDLCQLPIPDQVEGHSLVPTLLDPHLDEVNRPVVMELEPKEVGQASWQALLEGHWKLVCRTDSEGHFSAQLFDWKRDPYDKKEMGSIHPDLIIQMRDRLGIWEQQSLARKRKLQFSEIKQAATLTPEDVELLKTLGYVQ